MLKQLILCILCANSSLYSMDDNAVIKKITNRIRDREFTLVLDMRNVPHEKVVNCCYIALADVISDMDKVHNFPTENLNDLKVKKKIYTILEDHKSWVCTLGLMHCRLHQEKTGQVITLEEAFKNKH